MFSSFGAQNLVVLSVAAAILLTGARAQAAAWYCESLDGDPTYTCNNNTAGGYWTVSSAAMVEGNAMPIYSGTFDNNASGVRFAADFNWPTACTVGNPEYYFYTLDSNSTERFGFPALYQADDLNSWTAYIRTDAKMFVGWSQGYGPNTTSALSLDSTVGGSLYPDAPSFATYLGKTYLFFGSDSTSVAGSSVIIYATNSSGTWSTATALPISGSSSRRHPAAVVFNGTLYLFFWDESQGLLSMVTFNGTSWSAEQIIDGAGPLSLASGATYDFVGYYPSTLVVGATLYVFYEDFGSGAGPGSLKVATLSGGNWAVKTIEQGSMPYGVTAYQPPAAVFSGGVVRVYYFNRNTAALREAYLSNGTWHANDIDGTSSSYCTGRETNGMLYQGVAVVSEGSPAYPHVFYSDLNGNLRVAWIQ
jgi:hypothetical protein